MFDPSATLKRLDAVQPDEGLIPTLVHGDPDIHRLELERVFGRNWLFVAHASEIAREGDFVQRQMGEQSVIVVRGKDGHVRVFLNVCPHRGMQLCHEDAGSTTVFRCPYHGFTFVNDGSLSGVPFRKDAYPAGVDRGRLQLSEARVDIYRDLVFATWNDRAPALEDHLGNLKWYLDIVVGRADMEVVGVPQQWMVPCAWKVATENFVADAYHTATVHAFLAKLGLTEGFDFGREGFHVVPEDGHGLGIGTQDDGPWYPDEVRDEIERCLESPQVELLNQVKNFHGNCYPNLSFLIPNVIPLDGRRVTSTTLRQWQPAGPAHIRVVSWLLVERNAPSWWKDLALRAHVLTFGASGMLEQDDTEIWQAVTDNAVGLQVRQEPWMMDYTMGMGKPQAEGFAGPGKVYEGKFSEASARGFYRRWLRDLRQEGAA